MAGQDELIYRVVYESDEASFKAVQTQLNALTQQTAQAVQKAQVEALKSGAGVQGLKEVEKIVKGAQSGTKGLVELAKSIAETKKQLADLTKTAKDNNGLTDEQTAKQVELKTALAITQVEYRKQERELVALSVAGKALENTYDALVEQNKALSKELRGLDLDKDRLKILDLSMAYRQNNDKLKEFDERMGNHHRKVGDYKNQIIEAARGLTVMGVNIGGVAEQFTNAKDATGGAVTGLKSFTGGFAALNQVLKANLIMIVVSAVIKLIDVFRQFDSVNHKVEVGMARLSGIMTGFMQTFSSGGGFAENIKKAGEAAEKILLVNKQLQKDETALIMLRADSARQIAELEEKSKQENRSLAERKQFLLEARKLVNETSEKELKLVKDRIEIARLEVIEARKAGKETKDLERVAAEARAQFDVVYEQSADKRKNIQKQIYALEDQANAKQKETEAQRQKRLDDRLKAELATADMIKKINDESHDAVLKQIEERSNAEEKEVQDSIKRAGYLAQAKRNLQEKLVEQQYVLDQNAAQSDTDLKNAAFKKEIELNKVYAEQRKQDRINAALEAGTDTELLAVKLQQIDIDANAKKTQNAKDTANTITAIEENANLQRVQFAQLAASSIVSISQGLEATGLISAKRAFQINKAASLASATIDGYKAITSAFAQAPLGFKAVSAALVGAAAFANVAKIASTQFNSGSGSGGGSSSGNFIGSSVSSQPVQGLSVQPAGSSASQQIASTASSAPKTASTIIVNNTVDRAGIATLVREGNDEISSRGLSVQGM